VECHLSHADPLVGHHVVERHAGDEPPLVVGPRRGEAGPDDVRGVPVALGEHLAERLVVEGRVEVADQEVDRPVGGGGRLRRQVGHPAVAALAVGRGARVHRLDVQLQRAGHPHAGPGLAEAGVEPAVPLVGQREPAVDGGSGHAGSRVGHGVRQEVVEAGAPQGGPALVGELLQRQQVDLLGAHQADDAGRVGAAHQHVDAETRSDGPSAGPGRGP
jgi:hypothetical protein